MKTRFILFQRSGVYYSEDTATGKQSSLRTKDKADGLRLLHAKNEAAYQPAMNLQIAQVYLQHGDPALASRTWQQAMETMISTKTGNNLIRWRGAVKDKAFAQLYQCKLIETTAEHFLDVLKAGTVSTNVYLRRIHNYAVNMHWLPWPVLPNPCQFYRYWLPSLDKGFAQQHFPEFLPDCFFNFFVCLNFNAHVLPSSIRHYFLTPKSQLCCKSGRRKCFAVVGFLVARQRF